VATGICVVVDPWVITALLPPGPGVVRSVGLWVIGPAGVWVTEWLGVLTLGRAAWLGVGVTPAGEWLGGVAV
jgi:hypothetical protein